MGRSVEHKGIFEAWSRRAPVVSAIVVFAGLAGCASTPDASSNEPTWRGELSEFVLSALESSGAPSAQVAVGRDGEILFNGAWGLADVENNVPATTETLYRTASISKWMTATAVMALVEDGKLDLDAPIQNYCPAFPEKPWTITTRHLLTHTSGIRHYTDYADEAAAASTEAERSAVELRRLRDQISRYQRYTDMIAPLDSFKNDPLRFEPGTEFLYSSFGYRVLGCVLEGADGARDYRTIMRDEVFAPAGVASIIDDDVWAITPNRAGLYSLADRDLRRADLRDISENLPAGGHLATAAELVRFALAFHDRELVSDASAETMISPMIGPDGAAVTTEYGHGITFFEIGGKRYWMHTGGQAGTSTALILEPQDGVAIAFMTNADNVPDGVAILGGLLPIIEHGLADE
ncbi:MAG: serine hydrolase domain-containing protein [Maricaulaceae bacterium]|jgi:CubicO group peptidase (beta-lactamase class C family)